MKSHQEPIADRAKRHKNTLFLIYAAIILIAVVSAFLLDRTFQAQGLATQRESMQRALKYISYRIEQRLEAYTHKARNLSGALSVETDVDEVKFQTLARLLRDDDPSVINIARSRNYIVTDVHPLEGNGSVLGYDYRRNPDQLSSVERALVSGKTVIVGPIHLLQGGLGIIMRTAQPGPDKTVDTIVINFYRFLIDSGLTPDQTGYLTAARFKGRVDHDEKGITGRNSVWESDPVLTTVRIGDADIEIGIVPAEGWTVDLTYRFILALLAVSIVTIAIRGVNYARRLIIERADAKRMLLAAIESINDGFVIYDKDDRFVMCNERYRQIYKVSNDYFVPGVSFETIIRKGVELGQYPEAEGREEEWITNRLRLHANPKGQIEMLLPDGTWIKVAESKTKDGSTVGFRIDITELKLALQAAEQANQAKTDFLNNISHELRTPLSVVLGYVAFLKKVDIFPQFLSLKNAIGDREDLQQLLDEFARVIGQQASKTERSGKHLLNLINSVLDWAKLSSGNVELKYDAFDLGQLLKYLGEEFQNEAAKKDIRLDVDVGSVSVQGDTLRLRQVFMNLINNAIKFTDQGYVKVSLEGDQTYATVLVEDTGKGIPGDQLGLIFERFMQVDSSTRREHGGTGLGLAITKSLVELHGGSISVASTPGKGSRFRVHLPREQPIADETEMRMAS